MRKIISMGLAIGITLSLTACSNNDSNNQLTHDKSTAVIKQETDSNEKEVDVIYKDGIITNNLYKYKFTLPEVLASGCDVIIDNPANIELFVKGDKTARVMAIEVRASFTDADMIVGAYEIDQSENGYNSIGDNTEDTDKLNINNGDISVDSNITSFEFGKCGRDDIFTVWLHITNSISSNYTGNKELYKELIDSANTDISESLFVDIANN